MSSKKYNIDVSPASRRLLPGSRLYEQRETRTVDGPPIDAEFLRELILRGMSAASETSGGKSAAAYNVLVTVGDEQKLTDPYADILEAPAPVFGEQVVVSDTLYANDLIRVVSGAIGSPSM